MTSVTSYRKTITSEDERVRNVEILFSLTTMIKCNFDVHSVTVLISLLKNGLFVTLVQPTPIINIVTLVNTILEFCFSGSLSTFKN